MYSLPQADDVYVMESALPLIRLALAEDLAERGDVTSIATLPVEQRLHAQIIAKANGVMAGLPLVAMVYREIDPALNVQLHLQDGDQVQSGDRAVTIDGSGRSILTGERVALNFLQQLSGIATLTAQFVAAAGATTAILDTRKTTPGFRLLEKYAVRMGGGRNHRIGLYDMVMIKDNHIDAAGGITTAVQAARTSAPDLPIIVETRTLDEVREALTLNVDRILLDNMNDDTLREAVTIAGGRVPLEASGSMSLARVPLVAATGVDFISVGTLTHSAPALDLSMRIDRAQSVKLRPIRR